ncbi:MAG: hypothetical protein AB7E81_01435 [Hyphomicrobiaceae bacterium]|jgi:hypothetical protein
MGEVLPFKRRSPTSVTDVERLLFNAINGSPFIRESGVSAVPCEPNGVTVMRNGSSLGTWYRWNDRLLFMPSVPTGAVANVSSVTAALDAMVAMCQRLDPEGD